MNQGLCFGFIFFAVTAALEFGCNGNLQQSGTPAPSQDLWIETDGNAYVLQAINAAMFEINNDKNWQNNVTALSGTPVTPTNVNWPPSTGAKGTFEYIMNTKKIRFGSTLTYSPFSVLNGSCLSGLEIDLANMIADRFGSQYTGKFTAEWVQIATTGDFWYDISYALSGDENEANDKPAIDVVLSVVTKTVDRENGGMARFTSSYLSQNYGLVTMSNTSGITLANIDNAQNSIACGEGTTNQQYVESTYTSIQIKTYGSIAERMQALVNGTVNVAIGDATYIQHWAGLNAAHYLGHVGDFSDLAMAVRPAKQPSTLPAVKQCTMTQDPLYSADQKNCKEKSTSSCTTCSGYSSCSYLLSEKLEGSCCSGSCCKTKTNGRCTKSVSKKKSVSCTTSYTVKFVAKGMNDFTEKEVSDNIFVDCGSSKSCAERLISDPQYKKNMNVNCTVSSSGEISFPEMIVSAASHRFISVYSVLCLFVWYSFF